MTLRELPIGEINHAPEDVLQVTLRYLRAELRRRSLPQHDQTAQTTGPYADYLEPVHWRFRGRGVGTPNTRSTGAARIMVKSSHLLDTNMWIYLLKGQPPTLVARLGTIDPDSIAFCSIVKAELLYGAYRYGNPENDWTSCMTCSAAIAHSRLMTQPPKPMGESATRWR